MGTSQYESVICDELREKHFYNSIFDSLNPLGDQLMQALSVFDQRPERMRSIVGWDWIIGVRGAVERKTRLTRPVGKIRAKPATHP